MRARWLVFILPWLMSGCDSGSPSRKYSLSDEFVNPHDRGLYKALHTALKDSSHDEQASNAKLVEVSTGVSQSLRELAKIQRSVHNVQHVSDDPKMLQVALPQRTTIDWTGPVDRFMEKIAHTAGLRYRVVGTPPPVPIIVSVNKRDVRMGDLIRDVAYQVQNQAIIMVTKDKVIELRYI